MHLNSCCHIVSYAIMQCLVYSMKLALTACVYMLLGVVCHKCGRPLHFAQTDDDISSPGCPFWY